MEIWKKINGFDKEYFISNHGNVKSNIRNLKKSLHSKGYHTVGLLCNGKIKRLYVHRLVGEYFLPDVKEQINHIDGNKWNNHFSNLEWVTNSQNSNHAFSMNLKSKDSLKVRIPIIAINLKNGEKQFFNSMQEASKALGMNAASISSIIAGKSKESRGYTFKKQ
jgi:hypothetical protein